MKQVTLPESIFGKQTPTKRFINSIVIGLIISGSLMIVGTILYIYGDISNPYIQFFHGIVDLMILRLKLWVNMKKLQSEYPELVSE